MKSKIKVILATQSKDKKDLFESFMGIFGQEFELATMESTQSSGKVLTGEEELIKNVSNKSLVAFEHGEYDWGVSMEGGYCEISNNTYMVCVVNIRTSEGSFLGVSSKIRLPQEIEMAVKRGVWIGEILDKYQDKNEKHEYTNELCQMIRTRRELFTQALSNALLFLNHNNEISK
jgi:non-canonical (house-cleaning) NTP pyrophosphatase